MIKRCLLIFAAVVVGAAFCAAAYVAYELASLNFC